MQAPCLLAGACFYSLVLYNHLFLINDYDFNGDRYDTSSQEVRELATIRIKNATIVTMNTNRDVFTGSVLVRDDRIARVSTEIPPDEIVDEEIDAHGGLLIPGLVQSHVHLCQTLFRGRADDLELLDWLSKRIWPLEGAHDADSVYYSALLGIGELFAGGTTAIIDMETVHHTDSAFEAIRTSGIRVLSGKCMMDWGGDVPATLMESTEDSLRESVDLLEKWDGAENGRIRYAFAPRFAISCSDALLREVQKLSRQYGVKVHSHASENRGEIAIVERERGMRNVMYFEHLGLADENLILAHCIWLEKNEMEILAKKQVRIAHCPSCNMKLASGFAPVPELLYNGAQVSIGADGAPANNNLDMFMEMRMAALIHKPGRGPRVLPAQEVFELATRGGAAAMGLEDEIGSLEVGKKADLALVDTRALHFAPADGVDVYAQLVYEARANDVALTMVDGRIVYRDGQLTTIDADDVRKNCSRLIRQKCNVALGGFSEH